MPRTATRPGNRFRQGPNRSRRVTRRTPIESDSGGTQTETVTTTRGRQSRRVERKTPIASGGSQTEVITDESGTNRNRRGIGSPVAAGTKASGVGLLEAEFLGSLLLLILLLFADLNKSYADKVMSTMKRGTFIALLFFILALIAGTGPGAAKVSKAIGAMVFVGILLTSPVTDVLGNLDKFFKADWVGTSEHGNDVGSTSNTSDTGSDKTGGTSGALHAAEGAVNRITQIIESFGFGIIK